MPTSSFKTFLMSAGESGSTYEKLVDIKNFPELGGAPQALETTTLSDPMQTFVEGIQSNNTMEFTVNYELETYNKIIALKGKEQHLSVWFGGTESAGAVTPTGDQGKFNFNGYVSIRVSGKGVNEVKEAIVSVMPSSAIALATT